jgi:hypothetical protein
VNAFQRAFINYLKPKGRKTLHAILEALCVNDQVILSKINLDKLTDRIEQSVNELPMLYFMFFKITLFLIEYAMPPLAFKIRPFRWLNSEEKLSYLNCWVTSRIYSKRILFKLVSTTCLSHLYSEPAILETIGYKRSMDHRMGVT